MENNRKDLGFNDTTVLFNQYREAARKTETVYMNRFEKLKEIPVNIDTNQINEDLNYIAKEILEQKARAGEFKFGVTQLSDQSKLFVEGGLLKYRMYRHKRKSMVYFLSMIPKDAIFEVLPNDFGEIVQKLRDKVTVFNNTKNLFSRSRNRNYHTPKPLYVGDIQLELQKFDIEDVFIARKYKHVKLFGTLEYNDQVSFEVKLTEDKEYDQYQRDDNVEWSFFLDNEFLKVFNNMVIKAGEIARNMERIVKQVTEDSYKELHKAGYTKYLALREI